MTPILIGRDPFQINKIEYELDISFINYMCLSIPSQPKIVSRDKWNANPPKCSFNKQPYYNIITIHHTATSNNYNDSFKVVKNIRIYHQEKIIDVT